MSTVLPNTRLRADTAGRERFSRGQAVILDALAVPVRMGSAVFGTDIAVLYDNWSISPSVTNTPSLAGASDLSGNSALVTGIAAGPVSSGPESQANFVAFRQGNFIQGQRPGNRLVSGKTEGIIITEFIDQAMPQRTPNFQEPHHGPIYRLAVNRPARQRRRISGIQKRATGQLRPCTKRRRVV